MRKRRTPSSSKKIINRLKKVCVVCARTTRVILYAGGTYRGGHYFGTHWISSSKQSDKKTKVEYWECPKCYSPSPNTMGVSPWMKAQGESSEALCEGGFASENSALIPRA